MKVKIIVHTAYGIFYSAWIEADLEEEKRINNDILTAASKDSAFEMVTDDRGGYIVLGRDLVKNSLFELITEPE